MRGDTDLMIRNAFRRTFDGYRCRYYWHRIRVPWIVWVIFS